MTEFTGERVIPGLVADELWAEHIARYALASRYAANERALDIGCGVGYGAAELARHSEFVTGIDLATEALTHARQHYQRPDTHFSAASATALPFRNGSFQLVTAFEVVEHLDHWRLLLQEARRVLAPHGAFLISTPNKLYYAESRAAHGPNPFHIHEFEFAEFHDALSEFFPHVAILLQNRLEALAFYSNREAFAPATARLEETRGAAEEANFFVAVCGIENPPDSSPFVYIPRASNLLRDREHHIEALQTELQEITADRQQLIEIHTEQTQYLVEANQWAFRMDTERKTAQQRVADLQNELQGLQAAAASSIAALEEENRKKSAWGFDLDRQLAEAVGLLEKAEATVIERTRWAQRLQAILDLLRESRWLKLGRRLGLGPQLEEHPQALEDDKQ